MKRDLFEEDGQFPDSELKVNQKFKRQFEHNERRKLMDRTKAKYGADALLSGDESSSSSDDSQAELINPAVEDKFKETMAKLHQNDEDFIKGEGEVFKDELFDQEVELKQKEKKMTLKQMMKDKLNNDE